MVSLPIDVFVGLVTHPRTRFPESRTQEGLAASVSRALNNRGIRTEISVLDEDTISSHDLDTSAAAIREFIKAELDIELRWREYLSGRPASPALRLVMRSRRIRRNFVLTSKRRKALAARMLTRLANIEAAHLTLMEQAVRSEARWTLIFEDDAIAPDPKLFADELRQFLDLIRHSPSTPAMMNLSESFSLDQLGITRLLTSQTSEKLNHPWNISASTRHVTNTVCAVLYEREFLTELLSTLKAIPMEPVVPIDFKINEALLQAKDRLPGVTWVCSPAPLQQASGVPAATTKFVS